MSAHKINYSLITCNVKDCQESFEGHGTITQVRRLAQTKGWTYAIRPRSDTGPAPTFDWCPQHPNEHEQLGVVVVDLVTDHPK